MPAFNEAENLPDAVRGCIEVLSMLTDEYEVIVVDDCSTDETPKVLINLQKTYSCLRVIHNEKNLGCHPSSLVGLKEASGEVSIFLPADRQIPPSTISKFLETINTYDLVCSYRHQRVDALPRLIASRFYNLILHLCFGISLHDTHSAIAVKKNVVLAIIGKIQSSSSFAGCEFILRALMSGFRVTEIEIDHLPRIAGKATGANVRDAIRTPLNLLQFLWENRQMSFLLKAKR